MSIMFILQLLFQFLSLAVWLFIIPFLIGLLVIRFMPKERRSPGVALLSGHIIFLAVFLLIAIFVVLNANHGGMAILMRFFTPVAITLAALGLGIEIAVFKGTVFKGHGAKLLGSFKILPNESKIIWFLFLLVLGFQLFMAFTRISYDGDDAYYVAQSLIAWERGFLYRIEPYTGDSTLLDMRHALAVFPLWISMLAEKTRIHPTIISNSIIPLFLMPITYLIYFQISKSFFRSKKELIPMFMVIIAIIQMFGNVSIYTNETFLMTRTWQGKSFAANFVIPAILWLYLIISELAGNQVEIKGKINKKINQKTKVINNPDFIYWFLLGILLWMAGIASSLAVFLALIFSIILGFYLMLCYRDFRFIIKTAIACIPGIVYMLLYLLLT